MSALAVLLLQVFCCLGLGAATLRAFRADAEMTAAECWTIAFAIGIGVLGWLVFPLGVAAQLQPLSMTLLLSAGCVGTLLLPRPAMSSPVGLDAVGKALLAVVAVVLLLDLVEAVAPAADADSLAYHFNLAKDFLAAGCIMFVPSPVEGAVPLLLQMTYVPALGLGGETALTLWAMTSGWAAAALLFVLCRRHLGVNGSLVVALVFLTTPAVVYGGGSGQVETRIVLFALVAAWGAARALDTGQVRFAALAGLGAGLFAAAKYTGLLFVVAAGVVLLVQRRSLVHGAAFAVAAVIAGFQWYTWNAIHTGDPVFPMLFQWLGRDDLTMWTKPYDLFFKEHYFGGENPLPQSPLWLLLYPFSVTLGFGSLLDAGRVGFGPYGLLVLPFAVLGAWRFRDRLPMSPLLTYALIALLFYVAWFFAGGSQRVRHLLPVLPLFLVSVTAAAERWRAVTRQRSPLTAAIVVTIILQLGGHGLFSLNYVRHLAGGADREAFLTRNVNGYFAVPWINANLKASDRIFIQERQLRYYLNVPSYFGSYLQAMIELRPGATDARKLYSQLRRAGITHLLLARDTESAGGFYPAPFDKLQQTRCLLSLQCLEGQKVQSRTLPALVSSPQPLDVLRLGGEGCLD
ncbi:MAG: glycosyltransferase family 39 protein [Rhodospirillales bacterium]|nr:glycosyltransferase family 39 protein [Rhodospirillales bacterium]